MVVYSGVWGFLLLKNLDITRVLTSFKFPQVPLTSEKFNWFEITRNQFESNLTRVRIPPSPPFYEVFAKARASFFFWKLEKNLWKQPLWPLKSVPLRQELLKMPFFELESRWAYVFAVVEKSLCPSHNWISFSGTPLLRSNEALVCRRSWNLILRIPWRLSSLGKDSVM